ncbi:hypothetical protein AR685_15840 [Chryseobacterium sp. JAH]|nr:hypothetical protein AR685_15840 [Chryseobacterium sp. JAH]
MIVFLTKRLCETKKQLAEKKLCKLCVQKNQANKVLEGTAHQRMDKPPSKIIFNKIIKTK